MKTQTLHRKILYVLFTFFTFTVFECKKDDIDPLCQITRTTYLTISGKNAIIGYYAKYKRWAVYIRESTSNNIDTKIVGLLCDVPPEFQIDGIDVIVSGNFKKFNANEGITPQLGGEELYYFEATETLKK